MNQHTGKRVDGHETTPYTTDSRYRRLGFVRPVRHDAYVTARIKDVMGTIVEAIQALSSTYSITGVSPRRE
jgi:hypothetical protein